MNGEEKFRRMDGDLVGYICEVVVMVRDKRCVSGKLSNTAPVFRAVLFVQSWTQFKRSCFFVVVVLMSEMSTHAMWRLAGGHCCCVERCLFDAIVARPDIAKLSRLLREPLVDPNVSLIVYNGRWNPIYERITPLVAAAVTRNASAVRELLASSRIDVNGKSYPFLDDDSMPLSTRDRIAMQMYQAQMGICRVKHALNAGEGDCQKYEMSISRYEKMLDELRLIDAALSWADGKRLASDAQCAMLIGRYAMPGGDKGE